MWSLRLGCGLITLGNEIQHYQRRHIGGGCCGLITLGNEIQHIDGRSRYNGSCGLITLGNEIQPLKFLSMRR